MPGYVHEFFHSWLLYPNRRAQGRIRCSMVRMNAKPDTAVRAMLNAKPGPDARAMPNAKPGPDAQNRRYEAGREDLEAFRQQALRVCPAHQKAVAMILPKSGSRRRLLCIRRKNPTQESDASIQHKHPTKHSSQALVACPGCRRPHANRAVAHQFTDPPSPPCRPVPACCERPASRTGASRGRAPCSRK